MDLLWLGCYVDFWLPWKIYPFEFQILRSISSFLQCILYINIFWGTGELKIIYHVCRHVLFCFFESCFTYFYSDLHWSTEKIIMYYLFIVSFLLICVLPGQSLLHLSNERTFGVISNRFISRLQRRKLSCSSLKMFKGTCR